MPRDGTSKKLFLSVIFQEDYSGCWITKILPEGNADLSGKIEAGDQLAAINGMSAIGMKVDDICASISDASTNSSDIELTFLRYIGPFRTMESNSPVPHSEIGGDNDLYPSSELLVEDDRPRSTMSISKSLDLKSSKRGTAVKSPKRSGLKQKLKWLTRGKKTKKSE